MCLVCDTIIKDIWDAEFLQTFKGPCGQKAFIDHEGEGRFLFALHVDFFNMQGNLQCNATTSCGIVLCACLNLPLEMRYKPENMYLAGIIPGLREPSADQLNHFLDPLVSDLVDSWESFPIQLPIQIALLVLRLLVSCAIFLLPGKQHSWQHPPAIFTAALAIIIISPP